MLNQSDSENDCTEKNSDKAFISRLMRPTISSHNKTNNKTLQARKKQSYSTSKYMSIISIVLNKICIL